MANKICVYVCTNPLLLSASLYFSKRGAYWDRLCRDVVGSWLVGCHARALWPNGASSAYSYYGTLIGNPTPGIQWYKFRPLGWPLTGEWAPREALFVKLLWPLVVIIIIMYEYMILMHKTFWSFMSKPAQRPTANIVPCFTAHVAPSTANLVPRPATNLASCSPATIAALPLVTAPNELGAIKSYFCYSVFFGCWTCKSARYDEDDPTVQ